MLLLICVFLVDTLQATSSKNTALVCREISFSRVLEKVEAKRKAFLVSEPQSESLNKSSSSSELPIGTRLAKDTFSIDKEALKRWWQETGWLKTSDKEVELSGHREAKYIVIDSSTMEGVSIPPGAYSFRSQKKDFRDSAILVTQEIAFAKQLNEIVESRKRKYFELDPNQSLFLIYNKKYNEWLYGRLDSIYMKNETILFDIKTILTKAPIEKNMFHAARAEINLDKKMEADRSPADWLINRINKSLRTKRISVDAQVVVAPLGDRLPMKSKHGKSAFVESQLEYEVFFPSNFQFPQLEGKSLGLENWGKILVEADGLYPRIRILEKENKGPIKIELNEHNVGKLLAKNPKLLESKLIDIKLKLELVESYRLEMIQGKALEDLLSFLKDAQIEAGSRSKMNINSLNEKMLNLAERLDGFIEKRNMVLRLHEHLKLQLSTVTKDIENQVLNAQKNEAYEYVDILISRAERLEEYFSKTSSMVEGNLAVLTRAIRLSSDAQSNEVLGLQLKL